jgi:hypothetical protein
MPDQSFEEQMHTIDHWLSELRSLGITSRKPSNLNDLNDGKELKDLTDNVKQDMFRKYKAAYSEA